MKLGFSPVFPKNTTNTKFNENPSSESRVVPCEQIDRPTDMTKLIVAFRDFANAPKIEDIQM